MNIFWHGTSSESHSGYGNLTKDFTPRLKKLGLGVFIASSDVTLPKYTNRDDIECLPRAGIPDDYGNFYMTDHVNYYHPDFIFTIIDSQVLKSVVFKPLPWAIWFVSDSFPPNPLRVQPLMEAKPEVVCPSKFAFNMMKQVFPEALYCPYGIDTKLFSPIPLEEAKKKLQEDTGRQIEGKFFVSTTGANVFSYDRKNFYRMFEIWSMFIKKYPDSILYVHTCADGTQKGIDLNRLQRFFKIPNDNIIFAPRYHYLIGLFDEDYLQLIYSASDAYLQTAKGEAFGLPIVEAQACGAPVVVTDWVAMSELCFAGHKVPGRRVITNVETFWSDIYEDKAVEALEKLYKIRGTSEMKDLREKAVIGAKDYDVDLVISKHMMPVFNEIHSRLQKKG